MKRWIFAKLLEWAQRYAATHAPHREPGGRKSSGRVRWIAFKSWPIRVSIHRWIAGHTTKVPHDHPELFNVSLVLSSGFAERMLWRDRETVRSRNAGSIVFRSGWLRHVVTVNPDLDCWTIFIRGPAVKRWGVLDERTMKYTICKSGGDA